MASTSSSSRAAARPETGARRSSAAPRNRSSAICPPVVDVDSLAAADSFLLELGQLDQREMLAKAECEEAVAAAKQAFNASLFVAIDGEKTSFADRRKAILKGLETFANAHRDEFLDGEEKSAKLNYGKIGWRKSPPSLSAAKRGESSGNKSKLEQALGFILERIEKLKFFAIGTANFLRIKVEWDKEALKKAVLCGEIDRAELRSAGFLLDEGADAFFAEPHEQALESR